MLKIIVTTSDKYHHVLPVFAYLFNKYWPNQQVELLGYAEPKSLPENFKFVSMGVQGDKSEWSTDLRQYFQLQDEHFIWMMEDTFIKRPVDLGQMNFAYALTLPNIGRIGLTKDIQNRQHVVTKEGMVYAHPETKYRLSTQPSIWNRDFLLTYLKDGMDPWQFETQETKDDWNIVGLLDYPIVHNEGVRRHNIHEFDLNGLDPEDLINIEWLKESYT
jgi:hypothetical protein